MGYFSSSMTFKLSRCEIHIKTYAIFLTSKHEADKNTYKDKNTK